MVKVGFIVEGACEKMVVESADFKDFLCRYGYELVTPVINAKGGGNLLPHNIVPFLQALAIKNVKQVYILTDSEGDDVATVRQRVQHKDIQYAFVSVKALEAWFLADTQTLQQWLGCTHYEEYPENTSQMPWDYLKALAKQYYPNCDKKPGTGKIKTRFTQKMITDHQFSIERAAQHPNCPSARELVSFFQNHTP